MGRPKAVRVSFPKHFGVFGLDSGCGRRLQARKLGPEGACWTLHPDGSGAPASSRNRRELPEETGADERDRTADLPITNHPVMLVCSLKNGALGVCGAI